MVVSVHTFLFADLCGYTEYTVRFGDDRSAVLAVSFHELVSRVAASDEIDVEIVDRGWRALKGLPGCALHAALVAA